MIVNVQSKLKQEARDPKMLLKIKIKIKFGFLIKKFDEKRKLPKFSRKELAHDEERNIGKTARVGDDKDD